MYWYLIIVLRKNGSAEITLASKLQARKDAAQRSSPKARKKVAPRFYSRNLRGRTVPAVEPEVETVVALKANDADNDMSPCKGSYSNGERGGGEVKSETYTIFNWTFSVPSSSNLHHLFVSAGWIWFKLSKRKR